MYDERIKSRLQGLFGSKTCENIRFHITGKIIKGVMGSFLSLPKETRGKLGYENKNKLLEILLKDMLDDIGLTERWVDFSLGMKDSRP